MGFIKPRKTLDQLKQLRQTALSSILHMTTLAKSGHPGGSLSSLDLLLSIYNCFNISPANYLDDERDRIVVSHGHISPAVYSTLALHGFFSLEEAVAGFRLRGSIYEGHVEPDVPGVEWGTGNLGQGLSAACGFALKAKMQGKNISTLCLMGDGEQQKGQISEARRFAVKYKLPLIAIVDYNNLQISGAIGSVMPQDIKENYLSDGWNVIESDGHDFEAIHVNLKEAAQAELPTLILAKTVMGKGVSFMENRHKYHGSPLSNDELNAAAIECRLENKLAYYENLRKNYQPTHYPKIGAWQQEINTGKPIVYENKIDNRSSWGAALADIMRGQTDKIVVFDCDLAGSVKTDGVARDFPHAFVESGIMEHHTAVCAGALSRENMQVFWADFGVFCASEVYNQLRLNDINRTNLKVVATHCGLDVGEDGKTHQCIDYISLMNNLYGFKLCIPADPNHTDRLIRYLAARPGNYFVPMGRSKMDVVRKENGEIFFDETYCYREGKMDLLREGKHAALLVTGALCKEAIKAHAELLEKGIKLQVWYVSTPKDLDEDALDAACATGNVFTLEDHNVNSGLGNLIAAYLGKHSKKAELTSLGVTDYAFSGEAESLYEHYGLDCAGIVAVIKDKLHA